MNPTVLRMIRLFLFLIIVSPALAFELPENSAQCVLGVASDWDSSKVRLSLHERDSSGRWKIVGTPWEGRLGKSGLSWGRGIHPVPTGSIMKKEGDWKAPAGVFRIGGAWGYGATVKKHPKLAYRQITTRDLWVEDSKSPSYNRHLILDREPQSAWEKKQQMRQNDYPHSLKLFIAHNEPPNATPGGGSAIFFHIWRGGGSKPTAGCTTMPEERLRQIIAWINPGENPLYVLLPESEYKRLRGEWRLP